MARFTAAAVAGVAVILGANAADAYRAGPPPAHTGGFGEPTCGACHGAGGADGEARVELEVPSSYVPGRLYELRVVLEHPQLAAAGFQLSARFADGPSAGSRAGTLRSGSDAVQVVEVEETGVQYAVQSAAGAMPHRAGRQVWSVLWTAPAEEDGPVVFHVAANAANDDASEFGDLVVTAERVVPPAEK